MVSRSNIRIIILILGFLLLGKVFLSIATSDSASLPALIPSGVVLTILYACTYIGSIKSLKGLNDLKAKLPESLESLPQMNREDLPSHWKNKPFQEIEGGEKTISFVISKLNEQAKTITKKHPDVTKITTEIGITTAPGVSLPLWVYFKDGSKEGMINTVIKNQQNRFEYIWTEV